jgi:ubiquinone/menaquinone biosynthesis C-methylase UbiE
MPNNRINYNIWAETYDVVINKTRDLEAKVLQETFKDSEFDSFLEIGCGTGKNTEFLLSICKTITAVDFSEEMIYRAKEKFSDDKIDFILADISDDWSFKNKLFDAVGFSLVLEHIEDLHHIFGQTTKYLKPGGIVYIGEFHPFKQYLGKKARFETNNSITVLECYVHSVSEFVNIAKIYGLEMIEIMEYSDGNETGAIPRILKIVFKKKKLNKNTVE